MSHVARGIANSWLMVIILCEGGNSLDARLQEVEEPGLFTLGGVPVSGTQIKWTWSTLAGFFRYDLHRKDHTVVTSITVPDPFNPPPSLSFTEGGLSPGTLTCRHVVAFPATSPNPASNEACVTTPQEELCHELISTPAKEKCVVRDSTNFFAKDCSLSLPSDENGAVVLGETRTEADVKADGRVTSFCAARDEGQVNGPHAHAKVSKELVLASDNPECLEVPHEEASRCCVFVKLKVEVSQMFAFRNFGEGTAECDVRVAFESDIAGFEKKTLSLSLTYAREFTPTGHVVTTNMFVQNTSETIGDQTSMSTQTGEGGEVDGGLTGPGSSSVTASVDLAQQGLFREFAKVTYKGTAHAVKAKAPNRDTDSRWTKCTSLVELNDIGISDLTEGIGLPE